MPDFRSTAGPVAALVVAGSLLASGALLATPLAPVALLVASQGPMALREAIIADARAQPPSALSFERHTASVRSGGGTSSNVSTVDRWDGRAWTLVSINGKPPSETQRRSAARIADAAQVPGYHRLAVLLANAAGSRIDDRGRTVLTIPVLPPRSVLANSADISSHLQAEAVIGSLAGRPFVESVHVTARETFMLNSLIKVKAFDLVSDYRVGGDGRPRLASQTADSQGSVFGIPGGEKSQATFTYR